MPIVRLLPLIVLLLGTAACGDDEPTTPTQPTPTRPTTTETFTGTLTVNGAATHPFNAGGSGQISLVVRELVPDSAAVIGVSLGTFNANGTCQIVLANDNATQATSVLGSAGAAGSFCARVYDVGKLTAPTEYTIEVVHF